MLEDSPVVVMGRARPASDIPHQNPRGQHSHAYRCEVSVLYTPSPVTGRCVPSVLWRPAVHAKAAPVQTIIAHGLLLSRPKFTSADPESP
jgi:hypothetical protein